jgi:hypothetical protein
MEIVIFLSGLLLILLGSVIIRKNRDGPLVGTELFGRSVGKCFITVFGIFQLSFGLILVSLVLLFPQ